ncbi:quinolinate synthase NadA [Zavarzinia sp. CC-PAN008]|uniref:quinolinate synthase NadA n=1 Tax=Zavarzinia sp. CC-PAN008 TaxID=3243332 RepID=UPI003F745F13
MSSLGPLLDRAPAATPFVEAPVVALSTIERLKRVEAKVPEFEWPVFADDIAAIERLKVERRAVVLAHNYQTPEIYHGVSDLVGDSLALARDAQAAAKDADVIVMCGVHFMAETVKLLNPEKTVLIADPEAGCSLAESITGADVRLLRERYPGVPIVAYVNTTAEVKAEVDICCTSGNAVQIVRSLNAPRVIMLPDEYLAKWVATQCPEIEIIAWHGHCEVHERFTPSDIAMLRDSHPGLVVLAHPECPPDVIEAADYTGSTALMSAYVQREQPAKVVLMTECSMADNIAAENPNVEFVRPCNLCPHMKRISLAGIRRALETMTHVVEIEPTLAARARGSIDRMLAAGK